MAAKPQALARTAAQTTNATLYTVPNTTTSTIVSNALVVNTATSTSTYTINIDSVPVASVISIAPNATTFIDLKQVIPANATPKTITGSASTTSVYFHISGIELS